MRDKLLKVREVAEALDGYATGDVFQRPIEAAAEILRGLLAEGEAPATSKRAEDTMPPGWVQCPECLAGFPIEDGIKGGAPVAAGDDEHWENVRKKSTGWQWFHPQTAKQHFDELEAESDSLKDETPLERLRFFCSIAMAGQDWLDVEPFLDALAPAQPEALTIDEIHDCADEAIGCHDACASDEMVERLYNFAKSVERKVRQKIKPQEPK